MHYSNNVNFFIPKRKIDDLTSISSSAKALIPAGATNLYIVDKNRILRIVPAADMYIKFSSDASMVIANSTDILLKAGQVCFVASGQFSFMSASVDTANIIICEDQGW